MLEAGFDLLRARVEAQRKCPKVVYYGHVHRWALIGFGGAHLKLCSGKNHWQASYVEKYLPNGVEMEFESWSEESSTCDCNPAERDLGGGLEIPDRLPIPPLEDLSKELKSKGLL